MPEGTSVIERVRNIGIIAHIDAVSQDEKEKKICCVYIWLTMYQGKTTTTERMLYLSGLVRRAGGR